MTKPFPPPVRSVTHKYVETIEALLPLIRREIHDGAAPSHVAHLAILIASASLQLCRWSFFRSWGCGGLREVSDVAKALISLRNLVPCSTWDAQVADEDASAVRALDALTIPDLTELESVIAKTSPKKPPRSDDDDWVWIDSDGRLSHDLYSPTDPEMVPYLDKLNEILPYLDKLHAMLPHVDKLGAILDRANQQPTNPPPEPEQNVCERGGILKGENCDE